MSSVSVLTADWCCAFDDMRRNARSTCREAALASQEPVLILRLAEPSLFFFAHHCFFASEMRCRASALILARRRVLLLDGPLAGLRRVGRVTPSSAAIARLRRLRSIFSSARIVSSGKVAPHSGLLLSAHLSH